MKLFKLDDEYSIVCWAENTRYGFRHLAVLFHNGQKVAKHKVCYYNRTWERFDYQTVLVGVINKYFEGEEKEKFYSQFK